MILYGNLTGFDLEAYSRMLSDDLVQVLRCKKPDIEILLLDVAEDAQPHACVRA